MKNILYVPKIFCPQVSFHHADTQPELNEEARQLGLEPRYVYRVTQVANLGQGRQIVRVKNCSGDRWQHKYFSLG